MTTTAARDAFDDWMASERHTIHHLSIAEIFQAGYDAAVQDQQDRAEEWDFGRAALDTRPTDA